MNPVLVEVLRGETVESRHAGALAVLDADGNVVACLGDTRQPVFPRSAVKALQALPLLESGAADRLQLTDAELALACASHNGEELHVQTAAAMLAKAGVDASVLECGTHWPLLDSAGRVLAAAGQGPCALHNNCSGQHAGFICLACEMMGSRAHPLKLRQFASGYVAPEHPVMRMVTGALQDLIDTDLDTAPVGTDGCAIPTFGVPLQQLALAFARFGSGVGLRRSHAQAALRLREAVARAPFMVAGTGRFDTRVMERLGERVFCKGGAEGVYCAALPGRGLGVAIKIDDGNNARAAEVVMAAVIETFVALDDAEAVFMRGLSEVVLRNWNDEPVAGLRATPILRATLGR